MRGMPESRTADEVIKYCKHCNNCWEKVLIQVTEKQLLKDKNFITFYEDFPTYGKEKKTCYKCNNKTKYAQKLEGLIVHEILKS